MTASIQSGKLIKKCGGCGGPATLGVGVNLKEAMIAKDAGNIATAKKRMGMWFCSNKCLEQYSNLKGIK